MKTQSLVSRTSTIHVIIDKSIVVQIIVTIINVTSKKFLYVFIAILCVRKQIKTESVRVRMRGEREREREIDRLRVSHYHQYQKYNQK